jgi:hypothetical protein
MTQTNQPPADTLRYGGLKASIWRNVSNDEAQKVRYTVNYIRSYKNADGDWKDTSSLSEMDNLKLGHLISKVADRMAELKLADRQNTVSDNNFETEEAA